MLRIAKNCFVLSRESWCAPAAQAGRRRRNPRYRACPHRGNLFSHSLPCQYADREFRKAMPDFRESFLPHRADFSTFHGTRDAPARNAAILPAKRESALFLQLLPEGLHIQFMRKNPVPEGKRGGRSRRLPGHCRIRDDAGDFPCVLSRGRASSGGNDARDFFRQKIEYVLEILPPAVQSQLDNILQSIGSGIAGIVSGIGNYGVSHAGSMAKGMTNGLIGVVVMFFSSYMFLSYNKNINGSV